jgi:chemotaxis protein MotB
MARKKHHAEHPDERWLVSYADMLTLLFALFIVMYAMALVDETKFQTLKVSLHNAFASPVFGGGSSILEAGAMKSSQTSQTNEQGRDSVIDQLPQSGAPQAAGNAASRAKAADQVQKLETQQDQQLADAARKVKAAIDRAGLRSSANVTIEQRGLVIRLVTDKVLFSSGSWTLQDGAKPLLGTIAHTIDTLPNSVRVEGHTDAVPYGGPLGNLGLSGDRAAAVLAYMGSQGYDIAGHGSSFEGWGATRPRVRTSGASQANRRVEVVVVRRTFSATSSSTGTTSVTVADAGPIGSNPSGIVP